MRISPGLLLLRHLIVVTYGHPILKAPESVTGSWKGDVNIHCMYDPLKGYTQILVKWLIQRGSDPVTIFLRDFSGDHIQQAKYRGRLNVSHKVPGDVSLQLTTLQMDDQSHYTCEVTWQTPDGNQVVRDKIITLRVRKYSSTPLKTKTESPTTIQTSLEATTKVNSSSDWITETTASSGKGSHSFTTFLIIFLCCMLIVAIAYIVVCYNISQQEHVYEVNRVHARKLSSSGETMRVTIFASGGFSDEPASQPLIDNYSGEPCLAQEYQIITKIPQDQEILAMEDNSIC